MAIYCHHSRDMSFILLNGAGNPAQSSTTNTLQLCSKEPWEKKITEVVCFVVYFFNLLFQNLLM